CYGGFKGTPAAGTAMAHLVATDRPHPVADRFTLDRFDTGDLLDERGSGSSPWMH
ncbi:sarcosine oxidase subunit beta, partial [Prosthecomicrobium hirschii]